jgi:hypothetical protein
VKRRHPSLPRFTPAALALAALASASCRVPLPNPEPSGLEEAVPDSVESVLFLIGDAGEGLPGLTPAITRLRRDVEAWAGGLGRDSAVAVIFLGDNVYPVGVRSPSDPAYAEDTLRLRPQLEVVGGPNARRHHANAYFLAGNHDWGNLIGASGLRRLRNQEELIESARRSGLGTRLLPAAGEPGPAVLDLGTRVRLLFLDTHWWLQERRSALKLEVLRGVEEAMRTAGGREVVLAAHHPFVSGGAHGGPVSIWEAFGIVWLLRQTGSLVQDLNSTVYRELLVGLRGAFSRTGRPLLFVGGHDHSLQVLEADAEDEPTWTLVSGAGSKTTEVAHVAGTIYAEDVAGFMQVTFLTNGGVLLHVRATPGEFATCDPALGDVATCMTDGIASFETVYAARLK